MYKQISLFKNIDGFTVNLSLANTRTPRQNTSFNQIATCKLVQRDSSVYALLRSIAPKSESQAMSRRLNGMNITISHIGTDNNHLFILDENTSFLFDIDMNDKSISLIKVSDLIFVNGDHDPLYRRFAELLPKRTLPASVFTPCKLELKEREVIENGDKQTVMQLLEEQRIMINELRNEVELLKEKLSSDDGHATRVVTIENDEVQPTSKRIPVEASLTLNWQVEEIELVIEDDDIEALFENEVDQQQINNLISSLAINYNRDLLKAIKPLVEPEHIEYLEDIVKLLDKGIKVSPDKFTLDKIIQFYPSMFCYEAFVKTENAIIEEEHRLASAALAKKDWAEEETQFEQL